MTMPHSSIEMVASRLLWREQAVAALRSLRPALRRLLRREHRMYLTHEGRVVARFTDEEAHRLFFRWVAESHEATYNMGFNTGKEFLVAQHIATSDAGHDRTP